MYTKYKYEYKNKNTYVRLKSEVKTSVQGELLARFLATKNRHRETSLRNHAWRVIRT